MSAAAPALQAIRQDETNRLFRRFARLRLMLVPVPGILALLLIFSEPWSWRTPVLGVCLSFFVGVSVWEWRTFHRKGLGALNIPGTLLVLTAAHATVVIVTGGIESPVIPPMVILAVLVQLLAWPRARRLVLALQVSLVIGLATVALLSGVDNFVPQVFGGGPRAGHNDILVLTSAIVLCTVLVVAARVSGLVRIALTTLEQRWLAAQEQVLAAHAERTASLTALSAEIAHELKNPLASIKGLAGLIAGGLSGKDAERMEVLRREVDRMQGVLEDFLNFTRPLGPLSREQLDLRAVAEDVASIHEGLCASRGIKLAVEGEAQVIASCDPRKMHQVMVNLLQNAIEASASGSEITIEVRALPNGGARVSVLDRGVGLPAGLEAQVFNPGVTTKPKGSGIGLSVARGLVAQHGGELSLQPREGGGCVATATLRAVAS